MTNIVSIWREQQNSYRCLDCVGTVISWTKIYSAQENYFVALVLLEDGSREVGEVILNGQSLKTGSKVVGVIRRLSVAGEDSLIEYGVKFKVV